MGLFKKLLTNKDPPTDPRLLQGAVTFSDNVLLAIGAILFVGVILNAIRMVLFSEYGEQTKVEGCRRYGLPPGKKHSNLKDEQHKKHSKASSADGKDGSWKIHSLWIYPIKSCKGVELQSSDVVGTGLLYDRQFCFAQLKSPFPVSASTSKKEKADHKWDFITQRSFPLMSQVSVELYLPDPKTKQYLPNLPYIKSGGALLVTYPFQADGWAGLRASIASFPNPPTRSFTVPLFPTDEQIARDYSLEPVTIWKESPKALNMGIHVPPELKYFLGVRNPLTLFRIAPGKERAVFRAAPRKAALGYQSTTAFADAYPIHILSLGSVRALSASLSTPIPDFSALRFRPNVILSGCPAYAEDAFTKITLGADPGFDFHVVCRCVRCKLPNVDPATGTKHPVEPDKTLRATRLIDDGAPPGTGCFGMNMLPALATGATIAVGDVVRNVETGEHRYIAL